MSTAVHSRGLAGAGATGALGRSKKTRHSDGRYANFCSATAQVHDTNRRCRGLDGMISAAVKHSHNLQRMVWGANSLLTAYPASRLTDDRCSPAQLRSGAGHVLPGSQELDVPSESWRGDLLHTFKPDMLQRLCKRLTIIVV